MDVDKPIDISLPQGPVSSFQPTYLGLRGAK